jgi:hypothetical protein
VDVAVYAVDVGSIPRKRLGWARADAPDGRVDPEAQETEIEELVAAVAGDLAVSRPVALGFECPLYVPVPKVSGSLGKARVGDGNRSWSAAAGSGAMATGLVQAAWTLRALRARAHTARAFLRWPDFVDAGSGLLLWEAFVTAGAKSKVPSHHGDAAIAVGRFCEVLPDPPARDEVSAEQPLSLIAAAALWSGWLDDVEELRHGCLVVKAAAS